MNDSYIAYLSANISIDTAYMIGDLFGYYVIPISASISIILNMTFIIFILKNSLVAAPKYILLFYKIFITILLHSILIGYQKCVCNACSDILFSSYSFKIYQLYFSQYLLNVLRIEINFFEVLITYDRYCILKRTQSGLTRVNLRYIFLTSLLIALLLQLPDVFARQIVYSYSNNLYYFNFTYFGNSSLYFGYQIFMMSIIMLCSITSIIVMNIHNVIEYKKFIQNKQKMVIETNKIHADIEFTRMIIISTSLFAFGMININWSYILSQINLLNKIYYTSFQNLSIMISQEIMILVLINDIFLHIMLDTNLKRHMKNMNNCSFKKNSTDLTQTA